MGEMRCRWCGGGDVGVVLDLGRQPPADLFPPPADALDVPRWPLRMGLCAACGLAQLGEDPGVAEEPLAIEPQALLDQAAQAVTAIADLVPPGTTFAEFDSPHGGSWRGLLRDAGAADRTDTAEPVDVVVDVFGLMHDADQRGALAGRVERLAPGGTLLLQYHSLATIVRDSQWNALRHGHMAYYSTAALTGMLAELGLGAQRVWTFELYGGTVLLAATRAPAAMLADDAVLTTPAGLAPLADAAAAATAELRDWLAAHRDAGRSVFGYGAASRTVPLLVAAGVDADLLPAVADASPGKWGRALPGTTIPIVSPDELVARRPDVVLLFVPDLLTEVRRALPQLDAAQWAVSEPVPRLV